MGASPVPVGLGPIRGCRSRSNFPERELYGSGTTFTPMPSDSRGVDVGVDAFREVGVWRCRRTQATTCLDSLRYVPICIETGFRSGVAARNEPAATERRIDQRTKRRGRVETDSG